jgi:alkylation response protein AidB-like acyl-CoA dehydrogenase
VARFGKLATRVAAAEALLVAAGAKAFGSEVAGEVGNELFALSGASAADEKYDLSRHWRNARTHASHDPADWKYHHVGNYLLNDVAPPNHGQI